MPATAPSLDEAVVRERVATLDSDGFARLVRAVLHSEGFVRPTDAPRGSLVAERVEVRHGQPATRVRWIVRPIAVDPTQEELVGEVQAAEVDLRVCAASRVLLWFKGRRPGFVDDINARLPAGMQLQTRSGDVLVSTLRRAPGLMAALPGGAAVQGPFAAWRVLFLHDGSPLDYQLLRRLERGGAWVVAANLQAHVAAVDGLGDLFSSGEYELVAAFAGDVAGAPLAPEALSALRAQLDRGGDIIWNAWVAWAAHFGALSPIRDLLPVRMRDDVGDDPMDALREGLEMDVTQVASRHQALRGVEVRVPFALRNTFEPLTLADDAIALAADGYDNPLLACGVRGRGRSVYLNASGHSCHSIAVKHSPLDESPELSTLLDAVLGWLYRTRRAPGGRA